jgi:hypothetical protein
MLDSICPTLGCKLNAVYKREWETAMKKIRRNWLALVFSAGMVAAVTIVTLKVFADAPVLSIQSLGTNHFFISITNAVPTNSYELRWSLSINDPVNYPWTLLAAPGTNTNWIVDGSDYPLGFFRVSVEQFYSGVPDYQLADPNNPSLGRLSITIDSPTNGSHIP